MSKYVETKDSVVISGPWDYTGDLPDFSDVDISTIDVGGLDPMPSEGWLYDSGNFIAPDLPIISVLQLRDTRNDLLSISDWRDLPSYPGTDQEAWREYRQALRDLPDGYVPSEEPVFPEPPN
jgi:hypothetical protein